MSSAPSLSRRTFLKRGGAALGAAVAAPYFVPARVLGLDGGVAPSNQITLGVIGYGNRCAVVLSHFLTFKEVRCLAISDVWESRRNLAKGVVDQHHGTRDCKTYVDFREMLGRDDLQAVLIATGNRWHGLGSIYAAKAGKDVYSEKPICLTLAEGRALVDTCRRCGTVYQAGHQRRSVDSYRFQVEVVRKGMIGKLHTILGQVWVGPALKPEAPQPAPPGFDYDLWLGQTPYHPFTNLRVRNWPYFWDTGEGVLTDMGCHYTDIAQWGHDSDATGPVEIDGQAQWDPNAASETPVTGEVCFTYADGVKLVMQQKGAFGERFLRFIGSEGWVQVDDETNVITAEPKSILKARGVSARSWAHTGDHIGNFLQSIRTRQPTVCHPETAFRAMSVCMLGTIGVRLGRKLKWDPQAERFVGDEDANRMLSRAMRAPWHL